MQELNFNKCEVPYTIKGCTDTDFGETIYNHFENPIDFMNAVVACKDHTSTSLKTKTYIEEGIEKYSQIDSKDTSYDKLFEDVSVTVKSKLLARGFTTAMLYSSVNFTTINTGLMSKQRAMLGRRDCYYENASIGDGKLFHDMYINMSYSARIDDKVITKNSYALYALTRELAKVIPMRIIIVNHVGTDIPTCYSYVLKRFGLPIKPKKFLFFTSDSKRTFGWATYDLLNNGKSNRSTVGYPDNSVSIAAFNLDKEIDTIFEKIKLVSPDLFKQK